MASPAHSRPVSSDPDLILEPGHGLPGHTVDALLAEGKIDEARVELERLIQEGIDSGPGVQVTPQFWDDLRAEIRRHASDR